MKSVRTRFRRAESPMNREQSLREKKSSLRIVSHELKWPLVERWSFFCWYNFMLCPSFFAARRCSNVCEQAMEVCWIDRSYPFLYYPGPSLSNTGVGGEGKLRHFSTGTEITAANTQIGVMTLPVSSELHTNVVLIVFSGNCRFAGRPVSQCV